MNEFSDLPWPSQYIVELVCCKDDTRVESNHNVLYYSSKDKKEDIGNKVCAFTMTRQERGKF